MKRECGRTPIDKRTGISYNDIDKKKQKKVHRHEHLQNTSQSRQKDIHSDRTSCCNCDHRDSGGSSSAALNSAREKGRSIRCLSNLKQFGLVSLEYTQENDGYVIHLGSESTVGKNCVWYNAMAPYLVKRKTPTLFDWKNYCCPTKVSASTVIESSYGIISGANVSTGTSIQTFKIEKLKQPSRQFQFMDAMASLLNYGNSSYAGWLQYGETGASGHWNSSAFRHKERLNALFYDGHTSHLDHSRVHGSDEVKKQWYYDESLR